MREPGRAFVFHAPGQTASEALDGLCRLMKLPRTNPFGSFLEPGQTVAVKPNLVHHRHYRGGKIEWVITSPSLIRAVCDAVLLAIGPRGRLLLGDAPLQSADWNLLVSESGLDRLPAHYARQGYSVQLADYRTLATRDFRGLKHSPRKLGGDPNGYRVVNLGSDSLHAGRDTARFRVTNYDPLKMRAHHNESKHEYLISGSILSADCIINLPKLKTHRKSGLTCALKNMVGINGCKDWLPHHSTGAAGQGGDEYPSAAGWKQMYSWMAEREETTRSLAVRLSWNTARRLLGRAGSILGANAFSEGSWYGNDTLWRTILDLNRAALYAGPDGVLRERPARTVLTIVDALIAGEGEGPMAPDPVPLECLIGGFDPVAVDIAAARLACWPEDRLRTITGAFGIGRYPVTCSRPAEVRVDCAPRPIEELRRWLRPTEGFAPLFEETIPGVAHRLEVGA